MYLKSLPLSKNYLLLNTLIRLQMALFILILKITPIEMENMGFLLQLAASSATRKNPHCIKKALEILLFGKHPHH
jgi:hypothetical protein